MYTSLHSWRGYCRLLTGFACPWHDLAGATCPDSADGDRVRLKLSNVKTGGRWARRKRWWSSSWNSRKPFPLNYSIVSPDVWVTDKRRRTGWGSNSRLRYSPTRRRRRRCSRRSSSIALLYRYSSIYFVIWDRHENTTLDWMGCGISLCYTAVRLFDNSPDSLFSGRGWLGSVWLGSYCAPCRVFSTELHTECGRIWRKSIALLSLSCCVSFCISYSAAHSVLYNLGCIYAARSTIYCAILQEGKRRFLTCIWNLPTEKCVPIIFFFLILYKIWISLNFCQFLFILFEFFIFYFIVFGLDHGTPPPAPAPGNGMGAPPPPPDFPPRGSSFNHPSLIALQGQQQPMQQQRAATLVVTKDNSDEPPTYEVIPYSTGRWHSLFLLFSAGLKT